MEGIWPAQERKTLDKEGVQAERVSPIGVNSLTLHTLTGLDILTLVAVSLKRKGTSGQAKKRVLSFLRVQASTDYGSVFSGIAGSTFALAQQQRRAAMACWLGHAWGAVSRLLWRGEPSEAVPSVVSLAPDLESDPRFAKGLTSCATEGRIDMHAVNAFFRVRGLHSTPHLWSVDACGWSHCVAVTVQ